MMLNVPGASTIILELIYRCFQEGFYVDSNTETQVNQTF